ncbi:hypothetical protein E2F50_00070 [Rhizobium deserti]|uniref:Uncharacterized protein n=1 Tax=Rhizobium deserti TaxID=2547961 RepID=A0A4R5UL98_9HYPH|nr:hypothetical protein [Rhizobium deserti]TDK38596.1 hypothetical protein E2F50_00070 [Rhizobium deserti]
MILSRDEALKGITAPADQEDDQKNEGIQDAELARVEIDGRKQYYALRRDWSGYIASWISALILFNAGLTICVGAGVFSFVDMQWFITAVTVETFLQIVGMGYIAVRFLFSHRP